MNKEESKKLYEGKFFYEIVKVKAGRMAGTIQLFGPFDNIHYANEEATGKPGFVQVVNKKPVMFFEINEILVTDRIL